MIRLPRFSALASVCLICIGTLLTGCLSQQAIIPVYQGGEASALGPESSVVGLAPVKDKRVNNEAGSVGGLKIIVGSDLGNYIEGEFKARLAAKGYKVNIGSEFVNKEQAPVDGVRYIEVDLLNTTIYTFDSLLAPAKAKINIEVRVYGPNGEVAFENRYGGEDSRWLGIMGGSGKPLGETIVGATIPTIEKVFLDEGFLAAIAE